MNDYTSADLMAAILDVRDAAALNHAHLEAKIDRVEARLDAKIDSSIDALQHKMNRRFDGVYERFDRMDERFDRVDERFDRMDERFDRLEDRVSAIEPRGHSPAS